MFRELLLLFSHLVGADIFGDVDLEKVLSDHLKRSEVDKVSATTVSLVPESSSLSSVLTVSSMLSAPSSVVASQSMSVDMGETLSVSATYSVPLSSVASIAKEEGGETPIIIITQESPRKDGKGEKDSGQDEKVFNVIKNAVADDTKAAAPSVAKAGMVEEAADTNDSGLADFREGGLERREERHRPMKINSMPVISSKDDEKGNEMPYWTTIIVDDKLRNVKVNVKVMTVVESIDGVAGSSKDSEDKGPGEGFSFWDRSSKREKPKDGDVAATVSMSQGRERSEKKTTSVGGESSAKGPDAKSLSISIASLTSEKAEVSKVVSKSVKAKMASVSASVAERSISASRESKSPGTSASSSVSMAGGKKTKVSKGAAGSESSKASASTASPKKGGERSKSTGKDVLSSSASISMSVSKSHTVSTRVGGGGNGSGDMKHKDKKKLGAVTTTLLSYVAPASKVLKSAADSKGKKDHADKKSVSASRAAVPTSSVQRESPGKVKSPGSTKSRREDQSKESGRDTGTDPKKPRRETRQDTGRSERSRGGETNPEIDELFYVLKNMPAKSGGSGRAKMFVEGNFNAPEEEKLRDRRFKFSGYIQAT